MRTFTVASKPRAPTTPISTSTSPSHRANFICPSSTTTSYRPCFWSTTSTSCNRRQRLQSHPSLRWPLHRPCRWPSPCSTPRCSTHRCFPAAAHSCARATAEQEASQTRTTRPTVSRSTASSTHPPSSSTLLLPHTPPNSFTAPHPSATRHLISSTPKCPSKAPTHRSPPPHH
jgi:hypothetical protein